MKGWRTKEVLGHARVFVGEVKRLIEKTMDRG